jgi:hypothetical protein
MTQQPTPMPSAPSIPYPQYVMVPAQAGNGLGVAGFFIAAIGILIPTGIVALLGLLVSLVALGKAPRGFAGMGVLIGLIGTAVWMAITGVAIVGALAIGVGAVLFGSVAFVLMQPEIIEVSADMVNVTIAAYEYEDKHGSMPDGLDSLGLSVSATTDPWGNPYRYVITEDDLGFDVISSGSDGIMGTDDDLALSQMDRVWEEAFENFGGKLEEFGNRMERLQNRNVNFRSGGHSVRWGCDSVVVSNS